MYWASFRILAAFFFIITSYFWSDNLVEAFQAEILVQFATWDEKSRTAFRLYILQTSSKSHWDGLEIISRPKGGMKGCKGLNTHPNHSAKKNSDIIKHSCKYEQNWQHIYYIVARSFFIHFCQEGASFQSHWEGEGSACIHWHTDIFKFGSRKDLCNWK